MRVKVLAFGPIAEELGGRLHEIEVPPSSSIRFMLEEMGIEKWLENGIAISKNGNAVSEDEPLNVNDEIALLPPVSGG